MFESVDWKSPKTIAVIGVAGIAVWYFFFHRKAAASPSGSLDTTATTPSDQGTAPSYPATTGGSSGGGDGGGGGVTGLDPSAALGFLAGLQQSDLGYLGTFTGQYLDTTQQTQQQFASLATTFSAQAQDAYSNEANLLASFAQYTPTTINYNYSTTNQPVAYQQPVGTTPQHAAIPSEAPILNPPGSGTFDAQAALASGNYGQFVQTAEYQGEPAPPPVNVNVNPGSSYIPAAVSHGRGLGGPQA